MPGKATRTLPTAMMVVMGLAMACPGAARADITCSRLPLSVTKPQVDAFLQRPETTLELYPRGDAGGGKDMQGAVRELVSSDMEHTLDPVLKLVIVANGFQQKAIGAGLGAAARQCDLAARPADTRRLIKAIKTANSRTALIAFMATYIDEPLPADLGTPDYTPPTNPLGNGNVASPGANVFKEQTIRDPFRLNDPFAPVR